jgi:hypothetical protein
MRNCYKTDCSVCGTPNQKIVQTKTYEIGFEQGKSLRAEVFNDIGVVTVTMFDASYHTEFVTEISASDVTDFAELFATVGKEIAATKQKEK